MLQSLYVDQFVIIEKLDLNFKDRLTIFTGETGAGKSIILGAMALILGSPSTPKSIRHGHKKSTFKATFAPPKTNPVWDLLIQKQFGTSSDTEFSIYREMSLDGKDVFQINDKDTDIETLSEVGTLLVEIHGQSANHTLLGSANQLILLDLSGDFPPEILKNVADALHEVERYDKLLEEEKIFLARHKGLKAKKIQTLVKKFEALGMKENFIAETEAEYAVLRTAKDTSSSLQSILGRLIASSGTIIALSGAVNTLESQPNLEKEKIEKLENHLKNSLKSARLAVDEINLVAPEYEIDTAPLHAHKKVLDGLKDIATQTKTPWEDMQAYYHEMQTKFERIRDGRETITKLSDALIEAKNKYREHAKVLSEKRVIAAKEMSAKITAELAPLKLEKAEFEVVVEEKPEMTWTERGIDQVTFTARMNPGMPFSPIADTASGGEMARMILAIKVILQHVQKTPTLIFDEVDVGIGGAAAAAVGDRIAHLADNTQVIIITHSPQVASCGEQHLHISKKTDGETTVSAVRELEMKERIDEISRMLAGSALTTESHAAAQSLIEEASKTAKARRNTA